MKLSHWGPAFVRVFMASPLISALVPAVYLTIFTTKSGFFYINREPGSQSVVLSGKILQIPKKS